MLTPEVLGGAGDLERRTRVGVAAVELHYWDVGEEGSLGLPVDGFGGRFTFHPRAEGDSPR